VRICLPSSFTDLIFRRCSLEQSSSRRAGSVARRPPAYSPFRSFYGEVSSGHKRSMSVDQRDLPPDTPLLPSPDADDPPQIKSRHPPSETDSSPSSISRGRSSPRVRNTGTLLAPHGSFTSARAISFSSTGSRSSGTSSESADTSHTSHRPKPVIAPIVMDAAERIALERSAAKGDQASYRLGRTGTATAPRYTIGSVDNVLGIPPL